MHLIPQSWSHLHILGSVFPSVGLIFVLGLYVTSLLVDNKVMKLSCLALFAALAVLAVPTYVSGDHSVTGLSQNPKISPDAMSVPLGWGVVSLALLVVAGPVALITLWRGWGAKHVSENALHLVLGLAIVTL